MKTRIVIGVSLIVVVLTIANLFASHVQQATGAPAQLPAGSGGPPLSNPLRVALLKWYGANTATEFPAGPAPVGVAFDGANIWIANYGASTLTKLRANDGAALGTFVSGNAPAGVTFDGANMWVTNSTDSTVSKVRASDGKVLGTFPLPGVVPWWMTFDGAALGWGSPTQTRTKEMDDRVAARFPPPGVCQKRRFDRASKQQDLRGTTFWELGVPERHGFRTASHCRIVANLERIVAAVS
jgi:hypothetical protein